MNPTLRFAATLMLALLAASAVLAQSATSGAPPPPRIESAGGIDYVNGGAGEEARSAIAQVQSQFPLRIVFSNAAGQYVVADRVSVRNGASEVLSVASAGPMLLVKLPPGNYTIDAAYEGRTAQRTVSVGTSSRTLNWAW